MNYNLNSLIKKYVKAELVKSKPPFTPLTSWPVNLPRPVLNPVAVDSGRDRYNELTAEYFQLLCKPYHSKAGELRLYRLSYTLPLMDHYATKMELPAFQRRYMLKLINRAYQSEAPHPKRLWPYIFPAHDRFQHGAFL